ncbi:MAG: transcriptional regulator [Elusimicrobia bacterium HGW-Elusimicrobia-1]|jgi:ArsR family transcriptional regulator|nr:MAG: transcriptional regulator [Elusimicrobia bacterium HGW-Elusimicrobia-1]
MDEIYELHAEVCKTLANPVRLMIINTLRAKKMCASEVLKKVKTNKVILSQHMSLLVEQGVVTAERKGRNVFYELSNPDIIKACDIMRKVLVRNLQKNKRLLGKIK